MNRNMFSVARQSTVGGTRARFSLTKNGYPIYLASSGLNKTANHGESRSVEAKELFAAVSGSVVALQLLPELIISNVALRNMDRTGNQRAKASTCGALEPPRQGSHARVAYQARPRKRSEIYRNQLRPSSLEAMSVLVFSSITRKGSAFSRTVLTILKISFIKLSSLKKATDSDQERRTWVPVDLGQQWTRVRLTASNVPRLGSIIEAICTALLGVSEPTD